MNFNLTKEEAGFILQVLGQLPTQTNAFPLYQKWASQVKSQDTTSDINTDVNVIEE